MGLFSSICDMIADTADTAVDVASSATKAGVRGVKKSGERCRTCGKECC